MKGSARYVIPPSPSLPPVPLLREPRHEALGSCPGPAAHVQRRKFGKRTPLMNGQRKEKPCISPLLLSVLGAIWIGDKNKHGGQKAAGSNLWLWGGQCSEINARTALSTSKVVRSGTVDLEACCQKSPCALVQCKAHYCRIEARCTFSAPREALMQSPL